MSDKEKTVGFKIEIDGTSQEAQQLAKVELALKAITKERNNYLKLLQEVEKVGGKLTSSQIRELASLSAAVKKQNDTYRELKRVVDTASDSLARKKATLIELKKAYDVASESVAKKMAPAINKLNDEIKKSEAAIGTHSRGVGSYKDAILSAGKQLIGFTSITALVITAVGKLKDAFAQTEQGTKFFTKQAEVLKTVFQGIISGNNLKDIFKAGVLASVASDKLDDLRIKQRSDLIEFAQLQTDINLLRVQAANAALSETQQLKLLSEAQSKEDALIKAKIADKEEELSIIKELIVQRPRDTALLDRQAQLESEIIDIRGEKSLRLATKISSLKEKEVADEEKKQAQLRKLSEAEYAYKENLLKAEEKMRKMYFDKWKQLVEDEKNFNTTSFTQGLKDLLGIKDSDLGLQQNKKMAEEKHKQYTAYEKYDNDERIRKEKEITSIKLAGIQGAEDGANAAFESKRNRLQAEMQAELSNQNLTEAQKIAITKKYAKQQQKIDITKTIINGVLAIAKTFADLGWPAAIVPAVLLAAQTAISVATIKAQKFAKGGKITSGMPINTGTVDDTLIAVNKSETVLTKQHVARLGGSGVMHRIGVPGYAEGGYIGSQVPEIASAGFDIAAMAKLINDKKVILEVHKLNKAQEEVSTIMQTQPI